MKLKPHQDFALSDTPYGILNITVNHDGGKILKISFKFWDYRISVIFRLPRPCH